MDPDQTARIMLVLSWQGSYVFSSTFLWKGELSYSPRRRRRRWRHTLVKFFVPPHFISEVLQVWLWNLPYLFTIITSIYRQEYITLSRFLTELWPFFDLESVLSLVKFFVPPHFISKPLEVLLWNWPYLFTITTFINRQEDITLSRFLTELCPFLT